MPRIAALIVAAGRGHRFGAEIPKQYCPIEGRMMLHHTILCFARHQSIDTIRVVIHPDDRQLYDQATAELGSASEKLGPPINGGSSRQDSVRLGLVDLASDPPESVLIHDAARPLVDVDTISKVIEATDIGMGAIAARAVSDSIARVQEGLIEETVDRSQLWAAQTPQGFRYSDILAAHQTAANSNQNHTDDAAVARAAGLRVTIVEGNSENFKVTTATDLDRAAVALGEATMQTRVGFGIDVHAFDKSPGGPDHKNNVNVILCGVAIPHPYELAGHSDADVGLHAATDAILGALGAGDIGDHFPPTDPQWKGTASHIFLEHAVALAQKAGLDLIHLDITLICEAPKIGPHRTAMTARLAEICGVAPTQISVKATTTERLGFTGRGEGIAAQAVATVGPT